MSENYQKLYMAKKENLTSSSNQKVGDVSVELERARSSSPKPRGSVESVSICNKKVAYKSELEELKNIVALLEKTLNSNNNEMLLFKNEFKNFESTLTTKLNDHKNESLKSAINEAVKGFNENIKKVASEMISHLDSINELKSRVETIENIL